MNFKVVYDVMAALMVTEIAAKAMPKAAPVAEEDERAAASAGKGEEMEPAPDSSQKYRPYDKPFDGGSASYASYGTYGGGDYKSGGGQEGGYQGVVAVITSPSGGDHHGKQHDKSGGGDQRGKQRKSEGGDHNDKAGDKKDDNNGGAADVGGGYYPTSSIKTAAAYAGDDGAGVYAYDGSRFYPGDGAYVHMYGGAPRRYPEYQAAGSAPNPYVDYAGVYPAPVEGYVAPEYARTVPAAPAAQYAPYRGYLPGQYK